MLASDITPAAARVEEGPPPAGPRSTGLIVVLLLHARQRWRPAARPHAHASCMLAALVAGSIARAARQQGSSWHCRRRSCPRRTQPRKCCHTHARAPPPAHMRSAVMRTACMPPCAPPALHSHALCPPAPMRSALLVRTPPYSLALRSQAPFSSSATAARALTRTNAAGASATASHAAGYSRASRGYGGAAPLAALPGEPRRGRSSDGCPSMGTSVPVLRPGCGCWQG